MTFTSEAERLRAREAMFAAIDNVNDGMNASEQDKAEERKLAGEGFDRLYPPVVEAPAPEVGWNTAAAAVEQVRSEIRDRLESVMCDRTLCGHFLPMEILACCDSDWPKYSLETRPVLAEPPQAGARWDERLSVVAMFDTVFPPVVEAPAPDPWYSDKSAVGRAIEARRKPATPSPAFTAAVDEVEECARKHQYSPHIFPYADVVSARAALVRCHLEEVNDGR